MDMSHVAYPIIIQSSSDDDPIPVAQNLPYAGKTKGLKNPKGLASKNTPSRQSLCNTSPASSIRSSSTNPSIFDDDSSPAGTPLTPPLLDKPHPSASLRPSSVKLKRPSKLSFDGKHRKESGSFNTGPSLANPSPRGTPRCPSTPELGDQNAEQHDLETMNDMLPYLSLDTPVRQKIFKPKLGRETTATVDSISVLLGSMSLQDDDTIPRQRSEAANHAVDEEIIAVKGAPLYVLNHDIYVPEGEKKETPVMLRPEIETECNQVAKNTPRSPAPEKANSNEAYQQQTLCSPIITAPAPSKLPSRSKKSTESLSPNPSGARLRSRSEPQPQLGKSIGSPSVSRPASSSKPRKRASRKSKNSSSHSKEVKESQIIDLTTESHSSTAGSSYAEEVEVQPIDLTTEPHSSSTNSCTSERMEQVAHFDFDITESITISGTPDKDTSMPHRETVLNIQEDSKVTGPKFKKYNKEKSVTELNQVILGAVRNKTREGKLATYFFTTLFLLAFPYATRNSLFSKLLSKLFPKYPSSFSDIDEGFIYIFKSDDYPGYFKIGKTKRKPADRIKEWKKQCNFTCMYVLDPKDKLFKHYGIVEQLIQAELWNERRFFECKQCTREHQFLMGDRVGTMHGEWFEVTEAHALEVVEKWRSWIVTHRPYTRRAILTPFWKWKYQEALDSGEVDWVKWRSSEPSEQLPYTWSCMRAFPEEDLPFVVGFVLLFMVVLGLINLFRPIDVSGETVFKTGLGISLFIILYKRTYC